MRHSILKQCHGRLAKTFQRSHVASRLRKTSGPDAHERYHNVQIHVRLSMKPNHVRLMVPYSICFLRIWSLSKGCHRNAVRKAVERLSKGCRSTVIERLSKGCQSNAEHTDHAIDIFHPQICCTTADRSTQGKMDHLDHLRQIALINAPT